MASRRPVLASFATGALLVAGLALGAAAAEAEEAAEPASPRDMALLSEDRICLTDSPRTLLVPRLLLSPLVANNTLILCTGRWQLRLWHTFLAAMLAALILRTFQIVFLGHRD